MRIKGVPFLLGLGVVVLSIGGVFGAWLFGDGLKQAEQSVELGTTPADRWEFENTLVTFNAGSIGSYVGKFNDGSSVKYIENKLSESIHYEIYKSVIPTNPILYDGETPINSYMFSHWTYLQGDTTHTFNYDIAIQDDTILTANYIEVNNHPIIYKYTKDLDDNIVLGEKVAIMRINENAEVNEGEENTEFMANNVYVEDNPNTENRNFNYLVEYQGVQYPCVSQIDSSDNIVRGFYTVYFDIAAKKEALAEWKAFGGHTYFERQYQFVLYGNPNNGWELTTDTPRFGYLSSTTNDNGDIVKIYKIDKVIFKDDYMVNELLNYEFKPYEPYYSIWPHFNIASTTPHPHMHSEASYFGENTSSDNLVLKHQDTNQRVFTITINVTFGDAETKYNIEGNTTIYGNYPTYIQVYAEPFKAKVHFLKDDLTSDRVVEVDYGQKVSATEYNNYPESTKTKQHENNLFEALYWVDRDTHQVVDFSTLNVTRTQFVYPIYRERIWKSTIHFMTSLNDGSWSEDSSKTVSLYDDDSLTEDKFVATPPSGYELKGWKLNQLSDTTFDSVEDITSSTLIGDIYIYPVMIAKNAYIENGVYKSVNSGENVAISASSIQEVQNHVLGTTIDTDVTTHNLITNSGQYKIDIIDNLLSIRRMIAFSPNDNGNEEWCNDSARFAIYSFGGEIIEWADFDSVGVAYINYTNTSVIFCRMNPATTENNWDNRWNQSADILLSSGYSSNSIRYKRPVGAWNSWYGTWIA